MEPMENLLAVLEKELDDVCRRDRQLVLEDIRRRVKRRMAASTEDFEHAFVSEAVASLAAAYRAGSLGRPLRRRNMEGKRHCDHDHPESGACCRTMVQPEASD